MMLDPLAGTGTGTGQRTRSRPTTVAVLAAGLLVALVLQLTVIGRLRLPLGTPDLLVVVVLSLALLRGPGPGAVAGFCAGLAADAASTHTLGRLALVLCLVGYAVGLLSDDAERTVLVPLVVLPVAATLAFLLFVATGALVDDPLGGGGTVPARTGGLLLYDLLLVPFVFPLVALVLNRLEHD